nr:MAG TPA: hypothetical protein [Bacteriophage sp.]
MILSSLNGEKSTEKTRKKRYFLFISYWYINIYDF